MVNINQVHNIYHNMSLKNIVHYICMKYIFMVEWCDAVHLIMHIFSAVCHPIRSETILLVCYLIMHLFSLYTLFAGCMFTNMYRWSFGVCLWELYTLGKFYVLTK